MAKGKNKKKDSKKSKGKGKGKKGKAEKKASIAVKPPPAAPAEPIKMYDPCRYEPSSCAEAFACRPNSYPGLLERPEPMAVVGSESGSYESLCKLLQAGFRCTDRVFLLTPWGNYVVFRVKNPDHMIYFVFDGCTCNVNRFRYYDLNIGTAGLLFFKTTHEVLHYIKNSKHVRENLNRMQKSVVDEICREFTEEFGAKHTNKCKGYAIKDG